MMQALSVESGAFGTRNPNVQFYLPPGIFNRVFSFWCSSAGLRSHSSNIGAVWFSLCDAAFAHTGCPLTVCSYRLSTNSIVTFAVTFYAFQRPVHVLLRSTFRKPSLMPICGSVDLKTHVLYQKDLAFLKKAGVTSVQVRRRGGICLGENMTSW